MAGEDMPNGGSHRCSLFRKEDFKAYLCQDILFQLLFCQLLFLGAILHPLMYFRLLRLGTTILGYRQCTSGNSTMKLETNYLWGTRDPNTQVDFGFLAKYPTSVLMQAALFAGFDSIEPTTTCPTKYKPETHSKGFSSHRLCAPVRLALHSALSEASLATVVFDYAPRRQSAS
jgi:hypothetical protein